MRKTARSQRVWIGAVCAALALSTAAPAVGVETHRGSRTMAVIDWNATMGKAAVAACIAPFDNPLHESRMYAMAHLAIHDALNAIDRRYAPYATRTSAPRSADRTLPWHAPRVTCWFRRSGRFPRRSRTRAVMRALQWWRMRMPVRWRRFHRRVAVMPGLPQVPQQPDAFSR